MIIYQKKKNLYLNALDIYKNYILIEQDQILTKDVMGKKVINYFKQ
jgi:hypothetical protein